MICARGLCERFSIVSYSNLWWMNIDRLSPSMSIDEANPASSLVKNAHTKLHMSRNISKEITFYLFNVAKGPKGRCIASKSSTC